MCGGVHSPANSKLNWLGVGGPGSRQGYQVGKRSVLVFGGTSECGTPVGQVCECSMCAVSIHQDQPVSQGHVGRVREQDVGRGVRWAEGPYKCSGDLQMCVCLCTAKEVWI